MSVILQGGDFGELVMGATQTEVSFSNGWSGKSEHVWPSGPMPSNNTSNLGVSLGGKYSDNFLI